LAGGRVAPHLVVVNALEDFRRFNEIHAHKWETEGAFKSFGKLDGGKGSGVVSFSKDFIKRRAVMEIIVPVTVIVFNSTSLSVLPLPPYD